MNITDYHPLKCKYSGSYPHWNNEANSFEWFSCNECLRANIERVDDAREDSFL